MKSTLYTAKLTCLIGLASLSFSTPIEEGWEVIDHSGVPTRPLTATPHQSPADDWGLGHTAYTPPSSSKKGYTDTPSWNDWFFLSRKKEDKSPSPKTIRRGDDPRPSRSIPPFSPTGRDSFSEPSSSDEKECATPLSFPRGESSSPGSPMLTEGLSLLLTEALGEPLPTMVQGTSPQEDTEIKPAAASAPLPDSHPKTAPTQAAESTTHLSQSWNATVAEIKNELDRIMKNNARLGQVVKESREFRESRTIKALQ